MARKSYPALAIEDEKNATPEVASATVQATREQMNEENPALLNVLTLFIFAGFDYKFRIARAEVLKLPCSIYNKKVKMKTPAHNWFKVVHR